MAIVFTANPNLGPRPHIGSEVTIRDGVFRDLKAVILDVDSEGSVLAEVPGVPGPDGESLVTTMERSEYLS